MLIASALMLIAGVVAVLVGSQLAWGQVSTDVGTVPLGFFLDLESIGAVIAVVGGALALLGLSDAVPKRSAGVLISIFGLVIAAGAIVLVILIDGAELQLAPDFFNLAPSLIEAGPAGFVVAAGGLTMALGGFFFIATPLPSSPPLPPGGGAGETPPGWYPDSRGNGQLAYWTGSRWTHRRRSLQAS